MEAVRLVELGVAGDAVEEERVEDRSVALGKRGINRVERLVVVGAEIRRGAHAGQQRRQMRRPRPLENVRERPLGRLGIEAAQHVVRAELDDQRIGVGRHRPVVAGEAVRRRIARDAGVNDHHVPALGLERRFELVGKRLAGR